MEDGKWVPGSVYFYAPNHGAPIFFTIAFAISGAFHLYQCIHYKSFLVTVLYPFCCLLFTAGFAIRAYGSYNYDNLDVYIASICITYAAPPLLELANYHILGRILYYVPYFSPIHPGRVLSTFAFLSAIVESLSGWGASYTANQSLKEEEMNIGHALMKTALLLQFVVCSAFMALTITFHLRCRRNGITNEHVHQPLITLYVSTVLIYVRTIFRTVEYFGVASLRYRDPGFDPMSMTPVVRYEWYFYFFEATMMILVVVLMNWRHPRRWLPKSNKIYLAQDGKTEVKGPGWKDPRPFWLTVIDPFDVAGLLRPAKAGRGFEKFWENDGISGPAVGLKGSSV